MSNEEQIRQLTEETIANQRRLNEISKRSPKVLDAVIAAVNGSIGGQIARETDDE